MMMYGGRDAATDEAARRPSVVRQADVDHGLPSVIVLRITLMSLPSSPVCVCAACPNRDRGAHWPPTHGPPLARPLSRRCRSACGWPVQSVPAPKIEYLLSPSSFR